MGHRARWQLRPLCTLDKPRSVRRPLFGGAQPAGVKGRIGGQRVVTATAHKLARLVYRMPKFGSEYVKQSAAEYESKLRAKLERQLRARALGMGFELAPRGATAGE